MDEIDNIINDYFNTRYNYVISCCENLLKKYGRVDLKYELATEAYFYITQPHIKEKLATMIKDGKTEAIIIRYVTMQIKWSNTQFKKNWLYIAKNTNVIHIKDLINIDDNDDKDLNNMLENLADDEEYLNEEEHLQNEKEISDKVNYINHHIKNSTNDQQLLYNMVFNLGFNNGGKLSKHTGLSRTTCYNLIKNLKEDIKNGYFKNNNED